MTAPSRLLSRRVSLRSEELKTQYSVMDVASRRFYGLKRRCRGTARLGIAAHCKALLRTMGSVTSRRVKSQ